MGLPGVGTTQSTAVTELQFPVCVSVVQLASYLNQNQEDGCCFYFDESPEHHDCIVGSSHATFLFRNHNSLRGSETNVWVGLNQSNIHRKQDLLACSETAVFTTLSALPTLVLYYVGGMPRV